MLKKVEVFYYKFGICIHPERSVTEKSLLLVWKKFVAKKFTEGAWFRISSFGNGSGRDFHEARAIKILLLIKEEWNGRLGMNCDVI